MRGFTEKDGVLYADNVRLSTIAESFGTPTYVYAAGSIREQYERLATAMKNAMPGAKQPLLCYACKANSNLGILSLLRTLGCGLEVVSEGELRRGLKAGFKPGHIVGTGVGKTESEIALALDSGIHQINVESLPELYEIQRIASERGKTARVVFRLNPDVSGGGHHKISTGRKRDKFGLIESDVFAAYKAAKGMSHVEALGLSMHIGSQVFTVERFKEAFAKLPAIVAGLRAEGYTVARLDIGGGFPIRYKDEQLLDLDSYASWVRDIIMPLEAELILEPGRYLVGNGGALLTRVRFIKESGERSFLILDSAMNDLMRPALYDAYHGIEPVQNRTAAHKIYDIVGPVCETGDTFATERSIPAMQPGDLAVIRSAGAYGFSMASNYNTRPLPAEVLVDGEQISLLRPRQTYDDLMGSETVPAWLRG